MTDLSDSSKLVYKAKHKIRFVTAASLFDGHDASCGASCRDRAPK